MEAALTLSQEETEWLKERMASVGGSEAPVIRGLSSWSTPLMIYHQKRGNAEDQAANAERLRWGQRLEDDVLDGLREKLVARGRDVALEADPERMVELLRDAKSRVETLVFGSRLLVRPNYAPWIHDTPDAIAVIDGSTYRVEAKTWSSYRKDDWAEGAPPKVTCQTQHGVIACDLYRGMTAVLMDFDGPLQYEECERPAPDDEESHLEICRLFMDRVARGEEPIATAGDRFERDDAEGICPLPDELYQAVREFDGIKALDPAFISALQPKNGSALLTVAEKQLAAITARFKQAMKRLNVTKFTLPDGGSLQWKRNGLRRTGS